MNIQCLELQSTEICYQMRLSFLGLKKDTEKGYIYVHFEERSQWAFLKFVS